MAKEETGSSIESEMRRRAKAKTVIAVTEEKLRAIQNSLNSLERIYLLNPNSLDLRDADKGRLRFLTKGEPPAGRWISIDWPDLAEISRLAPFKRPGEIWDRRSKHLAELGVPI